MLDLLKKIVRPFYLAEDLQGLQAGVVQLAVKTRYAVGHHDKPKIAMEGIARGGLDAHIGDYACQEDRFDLKSAQQGLQSGVMKAAIAGFVDHIVRGWQSFQYFNTPGASAKSLRANEWSRLFDDQAGIDRKPGGVRIPCHAQIDDRDPASLALSNCRCRGGDHALYVETLEVIT